MKRIHFSLLSVLAVILCLSLVFVSCTQESTVAEYGTIKGRVLFSNGDDHSGITLTLDKTDGLRAITRDDGSRAIMSMASSKSDGSFEFKNLEPGTYTIYASANDSVEKAVSTNVVVKAADTVTTEDLKLTATGSISGYVTLDGGSTGNMGFLVFLAGTSYVAVTNNAGYYCITGVPAGSDYQLVVSKGHFTSSDVISCTVTAHGITNAGVKNILSSSLSSDESGALEWKGSLKEAPNNPRLHWAYFNTEDGCSYIYDGSEWTLLAAKGDRGEQGIQGEKGEKGEQGEQGIQGEKGDKGDQGIPGESGSNGSDGVSITWMGELEKAPRNPKLYWAYYNTKTGCSYLYDGEEWSLLASKGDKGETGESGADGKRIIWKGCFSSSSELLNPEELWAFFNSEDGCSYIFNGKDWEILAGASESINSGNSEYGFGAAYKSNGIGRTIDLINSDGYRPKSGVGYIFEEKALFSRMLIEDSIKGQEATYEYGTSFESFFNKWNASVGIKVANNQLGIDGNCFLPGTADFNIELKGGYEQIRKEETKELYIKMHHNIVGKRIEIKDYATEVDYFANHLSETFKNAARQVVDEKTAEEFINTWGTHVIMAAYYGAAFEASYYNISHDKYSSDNWYVDIEAAVKAHLFFSDLDVGLDFDLKRDTNDNSSNSLTRFEAHVVGGNGVALASDLENFKSAYNSWANGLNEDDYTLIDFPERSLYCIWDFLDDSFATQKAILTKYFNTHYTEKMDSLRDKLAVLYNENSVQYLDDNKIISYQPSNKTLTFDFSQWQEYEGYSEYLEYDNYENGVLTVYPVVSGQQVDTVVFRGAYGKRAVEDNHLIKNAIKGISIQFENWTSDVTIVFENCAFEAKDDSDFLDLSSLTDGLVTIVLVRNNHISLSTLEGYSSITCGTDLKIQGQNDYESYFGGSIYSDASCEINLEGKLIVVGTNGINGEVTQSLIDGRAAIESKDNLLIKIGSESHLYGGNGAKPGMPEQVTGRGVTGANGFSGGNGGSALKASRIDILSDELHLHGGAGGEGGTGGTGSNGIASADTNYAANGGTGGTGGIGGAGGCPYAGEMQNLNSTKKIYVYGGNGGNGGRGGSGGHGGTVEYHGMVIISNADTGLDGGQGGNGGNGGVSSLRLISDECVAPYFVFVNSSDLNGGDGGEAGYGGAGGYARSWGLVGIDTSKYGHEGSRGLLGANGEY